jgi:glyoxylase-like metal-dependent hydrolase (beta-lactamase superfamily II)
MNVPRRAFLGGALSCTGYLIGSLTLLPSTSRRAFAGTPKKRVVAEEDFARIEQIADGVWAVISTPLKDGGRHFTTTSNGGIIAGRDGVLVVEGFYSNEGAAWLAGHARELTGREPTHAVVTHYHADHTRGLGGLRSGRPDEAGPLRMLTTPTTRGLLVDDEKEQEDEGVLPEAGIDDEGDGVEIDLGGKRVRLVPRRGHTPSDVTVHIEEPKVVWCGDLVWNGLFPNYVDAIPSHLTRHCEELLGKAGTTYVPGHGDLGDAAGLDPYLGLILDLEHAARKAVEQGTPAAEAAEAYRIPESLGKWTMFSPDYFERAFLAWERELTETQAERG